MKKEDLIEMNNALLSIIEGDLLLRNTLSEWGAYQGTISFNLYAITFIFCFLAFEDFNIPYSRSVSQVGGKSFGIYLLHYIAILIAAKLIYRIAPVILGHQLILQPILILLGLGIPLISMAIVARSRIRWSYRFLFG